MLLNPKNRWQGNEPIRRKLANVVMDADVQDALVVITAILARNAAAMPDAGAYLRGVKDFVHEFINLPIIEEKKERENFGLPNPIKDK